MKRTIIFLAITSILISFSCSRETQEANYAFNNIPDRIWIGEDFWTVPLEGWQVNDGRIECVSDIQQANFSNLTYILDNDNNGFVVRVDMGLLEKGENDGSAGVIIGSEALEEKDVRAAVYFGQGINMGINTAGYAFIEQQTKQLPAGFDFSKFTIEVTGSRASEGYTVTMNIIDETGNIVGELATIPESQVSGIIQFVNNFRTMQSADNGPRFWFDNIHFKGTKFTRQESNRFGPILWTMHTLSRSTLKMTAQMPPLSETENHEAQLQVNQGDRWLTVANSSMNADSRTVTWKVENWDSGNDHEYRVLFDYINSLGENHTAEYQGTIRQDPVDKPLRFGLLTCQHSNGFPYSPVVRNLGLSEPDLLYFSGDQIYEGNGGYPHVRWPEDKAILNYLGKWYMFGWAFGDLMRDIPTVVTPDDHDVFHGNLWGDGGVPFRNQKELLEMDVRGGTGDQRGFLQTVKFVNMVNHTQTDHLPDPWDPTPIEQGMSVWYTGLDYGRISFAIVSDRVFKSPPELVSQWETRHDHLLEPLDDPSLLEIPGLEMLGKRQEQFLEKWIRDWNNVDMKVLLSQTTYANAATHHGNDGILVGDFDSGGWPKSARDRIIRMLRRGFAFHANGDQHLASVIQYGVDNFRDAGYGFSPPAISTGYQRWFLPDDLGYPVMNRPEHGYPNTGEYIDGFGNLNYVYAVGNPGQLVRVPNRYQNKNEKASGYGMVVFDQNERSITMEGWRFLADVANPGPEDQFPGWPHTISQFDNYGREAVGWLPTLKISGEPDPVVEIINQKTNELEYSVRIKGNDFAPKVFSTDMFTIRVGYPEKEIWMVNENVKALMNKNQEELIIAF